MESGAATRNPGWSGIVHRADARARRAGIQSPHRRTGRARGATVQYVPFRGGLLLVGSNWGRDRHPSWSANLKAAQRVTVRGRGRRFVARVQLLNGGARRGVGRGAGPLAELSGGTRSCRPAPIPGVSSGTAYLSWPRGPS
ncbi:hypothetical protein W7U_09110 [Mycobacterium sp. H4Y]|nr:hypothetical protein W7U_09110 [Mycobacterium sp. H4Y]